MPDINKLLAHVDEALEKNNFDYAIDLCTKIITFEPSNVKARKSLWKAAAGKEQLFGKPSKLKTLALYVITLTQISLLFKNNPSKKIECLINFLNIVPNNVKMRTRLAEGLLEANYPDAAIAELEIVISCQSNFIPAIRILTKLYRNKNMLSEAIDTLKIALASDPDNREIDKLLRDVLATSSLKKGFDTAKSFRDVIKDKDEAERLETRGHLIKSEADLQIELSRLQDEFNRDSKNPKLAKNVGDFYFDRKKDYTNAMKWYNVASKLNPSDSSLKDKSDNCIIRKIEQQIEDAQLRNDKECLNKLKKDKLSFEIQSYERRIQDHPTDMTIRFELGKRFYSAGQPDKAIAEFQQSVRDPRVKIDSHIYLGLCFMSKKIYDVAISQFSKVLGDVSPQGEKGLFIRYHIAHCYVGLDDYAKAVEEAKKIIEVDINYKDISKLVKEWSIRISHTKSREPGF